MTQRKPPGQLLLITATDTDVGKTVVSAGLASNIASQGYSVCVYKPVQTGVDLTCPDLTDANQTDMAEIQRLCGVSIHTETRYCFPTPAAPLVSQQYDQPNTPIDMGVIQSDIHRLQHAYDWVLIEGAGGVHVPITSSLNLIDWLKTLDASVLVVTRPDLGTLNHTLLTVEALIHRQINLIGVIINRMPELSNTLPVAVQTVPHILQEQLATRYGVSFLGTVPSLLLSAGCLNPDSSTLEYFAEPARRILAQGPLSQTAQTSQHAI